MSYDKIIFLELKINEEIVRHRVLEMSCENIEGVSLIKRFYSLGINSRVMSYYKLIISLFEGGEVFIV